LQQRRILTALTQVWRWALAGMFVGGLAGLALSLLTTPTYTSHAQFLVAARGATSTTDAYQGSLLAQQEVVSYQALISGERLAGRVVDRLHLSLSPQELLDRVSVDVPTDTALLDVSVTDGSPQRAQRIASVLGDEFIRMVSQLQGEQAAAAPAIQVIPTEDASYPTSASQPQVVQNVALGLVAGLLAGIAIAAVRAAFDRSVRDGADISSAADAPLLGVVPRARHASHQAGASPAGPADGYRKLRNNLQLLNAGDSARTIMVSSALPGEGRTTVVANLAAALASAGRHVAVVDADLRGPDLSSRFGLASALGLTDVVAGRAPLDDVVHQSGRLLVVAAGAPVENPDEVLASKEVDSLLASLRVANDFVLIDASPLLPVADAGDIATLTDGVLLCVRHGRTSTDQLRMCRALLDCVGAVTLGAVLTFAPPRIAQ
jgi:capsular exopolysaccharide synthesis family protein